MIKAVEFMEDYMFSLKTENLNRGSLVIVSTADLHFGAMDPKYQYDTLIEQFINKLYHIHFDILVIAGDTFDHKFMANSDAIMYATLFYKAVTDLVRFKQATCIVLEGTYHHDSDQLKLFYSYLNDPSLDFRIVEHSKFEFVKGAKILCIPEEYDRGSEYYNLLLHGCGMYDMVVMHGTLKGAFYQVQNQQSGLHSTKAPVFKIEDFSSCRSLIISGHFHKPGCFETYFYYCGSPYRWRFDDDHDKGFLITLLNLDTAEHYVHFEPIQSHVYKTINLDKLLRNDPKDIINYVKDIKEKEGIDYLRIEFLIEPNPDELANLELIKNYYRNNNKVKLKIENFENNKVLEENKEVLDKYKDYDYIFNPVMSPEQIFVTYVNQQEGYEFITVEQFLSILNENI